MRWLPPAGSWGRNADVRCLRRIGRLPERAHLREPRVRDRATVVSRTDWALKPLVPRPTRIAHVWLGLSHAGFVARRLHGNGHAPSLYLRVGRGDVVGRSLLG